MNIVIDIQGFRDVESYYTTRTLHLYHRTREKNDIFRNIEAWRKDIVTKKANRNEDEQTTAEEKNDLPKFDSTTDRDKANTSVSQTSSIFENFTTLVLAKEPWSEPIVAWAAMERTNRNAPFNYLITPPSRHQAVRALPFSRQALLFV
ncbi:hypothetical protein ALC57_04052 [Trachymyrmex cornetzi]|uniref:Uncharacterized protein n=1 Tax=Trachymyrmex cornetzi TaxID=471704 RepID=A0A151JFJ4_9HYME|nr:hypothetical protein ALC57_04052 [Trachymyrmex cornetzi]